jgi:dipeptidyl aminopeptidase/acylaminoacyl peptidase
MIRILCCCLALVSQILANCDVLTNRRADGEIPSLESFFTTCPKHSESLSPDGEKISYLSTTDTGKTSLHVMHVDKPLVPYQISSVNHNHVISSCWINPRLIFHATQTTDQKSHFFQYDTETHVTREVFSEQRKSIRLAGVVPGDEPCLLIEMMGENPSFADLYLMPFHGQQMPKLIHKNVERISGWAWDAHGKPIFGISWEQTGVKKIYDLTHSPSKELLRASSDDDLRLLFSSLNGRYAYLLTNIDAELTYVARLDRESGELRRLTRDPMAEVDIEQIALDPSKRQIIAVSYLGASHRWQVVSSGYRSIFEKMMKSLPHDMFSILGVNQDRTRILLKSSFANGMDQGFIYDVKSDCMKPLPHTLPTRKNEQFSQTRAISYPAQDGCVIPAYFTVPKHSTTPWPLVVFPHGGPRSRTRPGYDARVQFLASRGYAILQPNFRGSRGYGKAFMNAGDRQWGKGVMQSDVTDGVKYLISKHLIDSKRVAIMGGSYGGYSALAGLVFDPRHYAAGISLFGISDLMAYTNEFPAEFYAYSGDAIRRLGDRMSEDGRRKLVELSPAFHAHRIQAPVLLYHGANDVIVPASHSENVAQALLEAQKPVEFLLSHDEGHGFQKNITEMAVYRAIEIFLHQHLGGLLSPCASKEIEELSNTLRINGSARLSHLKK